MEIAGHHFIPGVHSEINWPRRAVTKGLDPFGDRELLHIDCRTRPESSRWDQGQDQMRLRAPCPNIILLQEQSIV